ncbi:TPA: baseplate J/gp47 family protein [Salmonella enterica]|uniref:Baseplate J/gp47 family protein n=1 Tax=Salmonella enterica TaxID=28901 RepID=A0A761L1H2_SALER|nr:baseplate J/gp47 family protein [Salmonella enterica]HDJ1974107.1 baseplate J/gp47 family protein [Salmonella enterica subsp. enterica]HAG5568876.1 baseplate J/gp47 family protein [Salmonella enterica]HAK0560898.1 baseplate J/gp47 family protein [Salmonella enterica]HAK0611043.1 baseplate J/gp47 family protein [Salmonella enterica]
MPYQQPSLSQLIIQTQQDVEQHLPGSLPGSRETTVHAIAYAQAGLSAMEHEHLAWISRQIIASDADEDELLKHCAFWGVIRKQPNRAAGPVNLAYYDTANLAADTRLQRADGALFRVSKAISGNAGTVQAVLEAVEPGLAGNCPEGTILTFVTPVAGIQSEAIVAPGGLTGGANVESVAELLSRLLFRVQNPPSGGTAYDYVRWAREVPGITRAWCLPRLNGGGSVGVAFVLDNNPDIFPTETDIKRVQDYIAGHRDPATGYMTGSPEGIIVNMVKLTPKRVNFQIRIAPKTPENQAAVKKALSTLFYNEAKPGDVIFVSAYVRAISGVMTLNDFELRSPSESSSASNTELLTLGDIEWL